MQMGGNTQTLGRTMLRPISAPGRTELPKKQEPHPWPEIQEAAIANGELPVTGGMQARDGGSSGETYAQVGY